MDEQNQCWTGVILSYICPNCYKPDRQMFVVSGGTYDESQVYKARKDMAPCRSCKQSLPPNFEHEYDMTVGTLEQLRKAGYPVPPVN